MLRVGGVSGIEGLRERSSILRGGVGTTPRPEVTAFAQRPRPGVDGYAASTPASVVTAPGLTGKTRPQPSSQLRDRWGQDADAAPTDTDAVTASCRVDALRSGNQFEKPEFIFFAFLKFSKWGQKAEIIG